MGTSTRYRDDQSAIPPNTGPTMGTGGLPLGTPPGGLGGESTSAPDPDPIHDVEWSPPPPPPNAELIAAIHDVQISLDAVLEKIAELVAVMKQHGNAEQR